MILDKFILISLILTFLICKMRMLEQNIPWVSFAKDSMILVHDILPVIRDRCNMGFSVF